MGLPWLIDLDVIFGPLQPMMRRVGQNANDYFRF